MKWLPPLGYGLLLTVVVALSPLALGRAQAQPHFSRQPDMIPAGGQTTVSGAGFCGDAACSSVTFLLGRATVAAQTAPSIQVVPTPAGRGQQVAVYGRDFCSSNVCSTVTILLNDQVLTSALDVALDGTFLYPFLAPQVPDQYRLTARQTVGDGSTAEASFGLMVLGSDLPPGQTPAPPETLPPTGTVSPGPTASTPTSPATSTPAQTRSSSATPTSEFKREDDGSDVLPWALGAAVAGVLLVLLFFAAWRVRAGQSR